MKNSELLKELSVRTGLSSDQTKLFLKEFENIVTEQIKKENSVTLTGFGEFSGKKTKKRTRMNPKTRQPVEIAPNIKCNFSFSDTFKKRINEK